MANDIIINNDLNLVSGSFDANTRLIELQGDFNTTGGTFVYGTSTVQFFGDTDSAINGNNTFYNFVCSVVADARVVNIDGKTLIFEASSTQDIVSGGTFNIQGTNGNPPPLPPPFPWASVVANTYITLRSSNQSALNEWNLDLNIGSTPIIQYADVWYSIADPQFNAPPEPGVYLHFCTGWLRTMYVLGSYTRDIDSDGGIDTIEIVFPVNLDDNFGTFSVVVNGYNVNSITTDTANDRAIWINLEEGPLPDTDARPTWTIFDPGSLRDSGSLYQVAHNPVPGPPEVPYDDADPVITQILTMPGQNDIYVQFSETVYNGGGALVVGNITTGGLLPAVSSVTVISGNAPGSEELLVTLAGPVPISEIFSNTDLTFTGLNDNVASPPLVVPAWGGLPVAPNAFADNTHRVSDLALGFTGDGIIEPVNATDEVDTDQDRGGIGLITDFTGPGWLQDQVIELTSHVNNLYAASVGDPVVNFVFDVGVPSSLRQNSTSDGLWLPTGYDAAPHDFYFAPPNPNSDSVPTNSSPTGQLRTHILDQSYPDLKSVSTVEFLYYLPAQFLYAARVENSSASDWYRGIKPWSFDIHDIKSQVGGVTILKNVINPENGETTNLHYELAKAGMVTVQVFDISGALVDVLQRGRQNAGDYSTAWDGRNSGGRVVARGVYFIRIVAPDIDETRKVMVVK